MLIPAIKNRRSIRRFKPNFPPHDMIQEILRAAQYAPTSRGNKAMHYLVISEQATKDAIYAIAAPEQDFVRDAPLLIIPSTDPEKTGQPVQDLSLASENIFLQATELGLGSVWKNFKPPVAEEVKRITGIPHTFMIINAIAIGFPAESAEPHADQDYDRSRIHKERW
ncbi:MAG: nitroreductase family protein [Patescibacteria group bacterium]